MATLVLALAGCLDRSRVNASCEWTDSNAATLDLARRIERNHLRDDGLLAEELGIRLADSLEPHVFTERVLALRQSCTDSVFALVSVAHGVPVDSIRTIYVERTLWIDFATVFLPVATLFLLCVQPVAQWVRHTFEEDGKVLTYAVMVAAAPCFALAFLIIGSQWAWLVEMARLGNSHISVRAGRLPWMPYRWHLFAVAVATFCVAAWYRNRHRSWPTA